jgi:hypothetical protein
VSRDNGGAKVVAPGQIVRGADGIYSPSKGGGSASTLPMTSEEMEAVGSREKIIGFAPSGVSAAIKTILDYGNTIAETRRQLSECSYVLATDKHRNLELNEAWRNPRPLRKLVEGRKSHVRR